MPCAAAFIVFKFTGALPDDNLDRAVMELYDFEIDATDNNIVAALFELYRKLSLNSDYGLERGKKSDRFYKV
jgi:hypothetical protein